MLFFLMIIGNWAKELVINSLAAKNVDKDVEVPNMVLPKKMEAAEGCAGSSTKFFMSLVFLLKIFHSILNK